MWLLFPLLLYIMKENFLFSSLLSCSSLAVLSDSGPVAPRQLSRLLSRLISLLTQWPIKTVSSLWYLITTSHPHFLEQHLAVKPGPWRALQCITRVQRRTGRRGNDLLRLRAPVKRLGYTRWLSALAETGSSESAAPLSTSPALRRWLTLGTGKAYGQFNWVRSLARFAFVVSVCVCSRCCICTIRERANGCLAGWLARMMLNLGN